MPEFTVEDKRKLMKIHCDMYEGEDAQNPSVVTRLALIERVTAKVDKLTWAVIVVLLGVIANIVSEHLK
jgi:hypothetical protein